VAQVLITLLEANSGNGPTLSDTNALFHFDHSNKAASGAVNSDATLSAARLGLRTQKSIDGRIIRVTPKNLLVPQSLQNHRRPASQHAIPVAALLPQHRRDSRWRSLRLRGPLS
jgi:hypothetical protein